MKTFFNTVAKRTTRVTKNNFGYLRALSALVVFIFFPFNPLSAQQNKKTIIEGNKKYENKKYNDAEKEYKKVLQQNKNDYIGTFNLGNTYYRQGKYDEAANQFQSLTHQPVTKDSMARVYHNLGNSLLKQKKFEESISAYKNGLKNNPDDEQTRYNLSYAQKMLKQQQQQQQKNNKDKKENKEDKNKDKKEDKKNKDKNKNKKNREKQEQQPQNNISKEDAQRLLDALQNDEKNIKEKIKKEKARGAKVQIEKDW